MIKKLLSQIIAAIAGLWVASLFVSSVIIRVYPQSNFFGFPLTAQWEIFLVLGIVLGLLNYFVKPLLKTFALPLEIITLGLFTIVINMVLIWFIDLIFDEVYIPWILPLLYTSLIIWGFGVIMSFLIAKNSSS